MADRSGIKEHLRALQKIATRNGGTRYTGSQGHVESADYGDQPAAVELFDARGEYTERIPFDGRSDSDGFTTVGIPAGPDNINDPVLSIMSDAVAHSILTFAQSGTSVNGTDTSPMKAMEFKGNHRVK